jgi:hypothetical protein
MATAQSTTCSRPQSSAPPQLLFSFSLDGTRRHHLPAGGDRDLRSPPSPWHKIRRRGRAWETGKMRCRSARAEEDALPLLSFAVAAPPPVISSSAPLRASSRRQGGRAPGTARAAAGGRVVVLEQQQLAARWMSGVDLPTCSSLRASVHRPGRLRAQPSAVLLVF